MMEAALRSNLRRLGASLLPHANPHLADAPRYSYSVAAALSEAATSYTTESAIM